MVSWDRQDQETQRKNRNTRDDLRDITDRFNSYIARGEQIRSRLPSVMSALLGLALANPTTASAVVLPTTTKLTRPEIGGDSVADLSWPPKTGTFDEQRQRKRDRRADAHLPGCDVSGVAGVERGSDPGQVADPGRADPDQHRRAPADCGALDPEPDRSAVCVGVAEDVYRSGESSAGRCACGFANDWDS
jgi:hypothetical protein